MFFKSRSLLSLEEAAGPSVFDEMHAQMYANVYASAVRYWDQPKYRAARKLEARIINDFHLRHPARSFDWYFSLHRPYLSRIDYSNAAYVFTGIDENDPRLSSPSRAARSLLGLARERRLLSEEEMRVLREPDITNDDYWARYDAAETQEEHLEWYEQRHYEREQRRRDIVERVQRDLMAEYGEERIAALSSQLDDGPIIEAEELHRRLLSMPDPEPEPEPEPAADPSTAEPKRRKKPESPWADELHRPVECKSDLCGGRGKPLPHTVKQIRDRSWRRKQQQYTESKYKRPGESEESWNRRRVVVGTAWTQAALSGVDAAFEHARNPALQQHATAAFQRLTGHAGVLEYFEEKHKRHGNFYDYVHSELPDFSEWPIFRTMRDADPERHTRKFYTEAMRELEVKERRHRVTGRKMLWVEVPEASERARLHRRLLEAGDDEAYERRKQLEPWFDAMHAWIDRWQNDPAGLHRERAARSLLSLEDQDAAGADDALHLFRPEDWIDAKEFDAAASAPESRVLLANKLPFAPDPVPDANSIRNESARRNNVLQGA